MKNKKFTKTISINTPKESKSQSIFLKLYHDNLSDERIRLAEDQINSGLAHYQEILKHTKCHNIKNVSGKICIYSSRKNYLEAGGNSDCAGVTEPKEALSFGPEWTSHIYQEQGNIEHLIHEGIGHGLGFSFFGRENHLKEVGTLFMEGFAEYCEHGDCSCAINYARKILKQQPSLTLANIFQMKEKANHFYEIALVLFIYMMQKTTKSFNKIVKNFQIVPVKTRAINDLFKKFQKKHQIQFSQWIIAKSQQSVHRVCPYSKESNRDLLSEINSLHIKFRGLYEFPIQALIQKLTHDMHSQAILKHFQLSIEVVIDSIKDNYYDICTRVGKNFCSNAVLKAVEDTHIENWSTVRDLSQNDRCKWQKYYSQQLKR